MKDEKRLMDVELTQPDIAERPQTFEPIPGAWGRQGCTRMTLKTTTLTATRRALVEAWRHREQAFTRRRPRGNRAPDL